MPTEIQWRLRAHEQRIKTDKVWKHHSVVNANDAAELVRNYNLSGTVFEYRVIEVEKEKPVEPKQGPFPFTFKNKGRKEAPILGRLSDPKD
jgi:hypothetical protein